MSGYLWGTMKQAGDGGAAEVHPDGRVGLPEQAVEVDGQEGRAQQGDEDLPGSLPARKPPGVLVGEIQQRGRDGEPERMIIKRAGKVQPRRVKEGAGSSRSPGQGTRSAKKSGSGQ